MKGLIVKLAYPLTGKKKLQLAHEAVCGALYARKVRLGNAVVVKLCQQLIQPFELSHNSGMNLLPLKPAADILDELQTRLHPLAQQPLTHSQSPHGSQRPPLPRRISMISPCILPNPPLSLTIVLASKLTTPTIIAPAKPLQNPAT